MLHIVKSQTAINEAMQYAASQDIVLLVEDAVYAANTHHHAFEYLSNGKLAIYVLMPDVDARGLRSYIDDNVVQADFNDWVTLTEAHETTLTWE